MQYTHHSISLNKKYKPMQARVLGNLTIRAAAQALLSYADKDEFEEIFHVWRRANTKYSWFKDVGKTEKLNAKQYLANHDGIIYWTMTTSHKNYTVLTNPLPEPPLPIDQRQEVICLDP